MTKETFHQLPEEKKERVIRAAADLFAENGFDRTDVAQIARAASVAKGSIYNYFENKEDLYLAVCRIGLARFREFVYGRIPEEWDVYRQIEHVFKQGAAFTQEEPALVRLYLNLGSSGMDRFAKALSPESEDYFAEKFMALMRRDMAAGLVRPDIDVNLTVFLINSLFMTFVVAPVSAHHRIRMKIYLGLDPKADWMDEPYETRLNQVVRLIHGFLRVAEPHLR